MAIHHTRADKKLTAFAQMPFGHLTNSQNVSRNMMSKLIREVCTLTCLLMPLSVRAKEGENMILTNVPRNSFRVAGMFSCLASCFNAQGEDISPVFLRGLWKNLFMFTFDAQKGGGLPFSGHDWTLFPDFTAACEICSTLSYSYRYDEDLEWSKAWDIIREAISNNKPVMTTWEPPEIHYPWFALIVGHDEEKLYLHCYKGAFYEYPIDKFREGWGRGKGEQPWLYGAVFILNRKEREVDFKEIILQSLKQAVQTMNKKEVTFPAGRHGEGTFRCGFNAYEELIGYLDKETDYSKLDVDTLRVIGGWGGCHEAGCEDSKRHSIADYLLYIASEFKDDKRRYIERAAELYRGVETLYDNLLLIHPSVAPWGRQGYEHLPSLTSEDPALREEAVKKFERDMKEAAKIVRKILNNEKKAIQEIERVIE